VYLLITLYIELCVKPYNNFRGVASVGFPQSPVVGIVNTGL